MSYPIARTLTLDQIAQALSPFGVEMETSQLGAIQKYVDLLLVWNQSISLTALEDPAEIVARHFGESIFVGKFLQFHSGRLADVGTGGGFPGLPLKIAFPDLFVVLIESNLKKCAFLNEVKSRLDLRGVEVHRSRYEEYDRSKAPFDFICARALGDYRRLLHWASGALSSTGRLILWLGVPDSIIVGRIGGWTWDLPVRIPESRSRVIVSGRVALP